MEPVPSNYSKARETQRYDATLILEKYAKDFRWRKDGRDTFLDLGCATGDDINDLIIPLMPETFEEIVGVDISKNMIDYANKCYGRNNVHFEVLNIEGNIESFRARYPKGFDHVYSFYTLHWMRNLTKAMMNIRDLISPGGDCLLVSFTQQAIVEVFDDLAKRPKWNKFMSSVYDHFSPLINKKDTVSHVINALEQAGFTEYKYEVVQKHTNYVGDYQTRAHVSNVIPLFHQLNEQEKNEYWSEVLDLCAKRGYLKRAPNNNSDDDKMELPYEVIVIYAVKNGTV